MRPIVKVTVLVGMIVAGLLLTPLLSTPVFTAPMFQEQETTITVEDLKNRPEDFIGERVTINGIVAEDFDVFTQGDFNAFALTDETAINENLLIINPLTNGAVIDAQMVGETVAVTGVINFASWSDLTAQYEVNIPDALESEFSGEPVLIAEAIQPVSAAVLQQGATVTVADVMNRPEDFIGETVTIQGNVARNFDVFTEGVFNAFAVTDDTATDDNLLVINTVPNGPVVNDQMEDEPVQVTGVINFASWSDLTAQYEVDIPEALENEFAGEPVLLAESVELLDQAAAPPAQVTASPAVTATATAIDEEETETPDVDEEPTETTIVIPPTTAVPVATTAVPAATTAVPAATTVAPAATTAAPATTATPRPTTVGAPGNLPTTSSGDPGNGSLLLIGAVLLLALGGMLLASRRRTSA